LRDWEVGERVREASGDEGDKEEMKDGREQRA
jgi:hypothetical protein